MKKKPVSDFIASAFCLTVSRGLKILQIAPLIAYNILLAWIFIEAMRAGHIVTVIYVFEFYTT